MQRIISGLLLAGAIGAFTISLALAQSQRADTPQDIQRGRGIAVGTFERSPGGACFRCHGLDGKGDGTAGFPRLADQSADYLYRALKDFASGARPNPIMAPIAQALSDAEMHDVSAYYASQQNVGYGPRPPVDPDTLQAGAALAAIGSAEHGVQGCMNCHGPAGMGLAPTYPFLAGQYAIYLEQQLQQWKQGQRKGDIAGIMTNLAKRLTDDEIHAVSLYYGSIRPSWMTTESAAGSPKVETQGTGTSSGSNPSK